MPTPLPKGGGQELLDWLVCGPTVAQPDEAYFHAFCEPGRRAGRAV